MMEHDSDDLTDGAPAKADAALTRALRALAEEEHGLGASADVEDRLLAEARVIVRARQRRVYVASGAMAATVLVAVTIPLWRATTARRPAVQPAVAALPARPVPAEDVIFPLMYSNVPV